MQPKLERIFLHVGPPKTGTSILQSALAENRDALQQAGFLYPFTFPESESRKIQYPPADLVKHDGILLLALADPTVILATKRFGLSGEMLKKWIEDCKQALSVQLEKSRAREMILSSESFGNFSIANGSYYEELSRYLYELADEVQVILYARHPVAMLRSRYQHYVRVGLETMADLSQKPWTYPYEKKVSQFRKSFGSGNVQVRRYSRDFEKKFDIVNDIGSVIGFDSSSFQLSTKSLNESVSMESALLMDILTAQFPQPEVMGGKRHPNRGSIPRNMRGAPFQLDPELEKSTMNRAKRDLAYLDKDFGISFPELSRTDSSALWDSVCLRDIALAFNHQSLTIQRLRAQIDAVECERNVQAADS